MGLKGSKLPEARVLLLGLDGAGKSTLLYKLKLDERFQTVPTVGFNVEMIEARQKRRKISVTVWDVGGQKEMRAHWKHYYEDTAGLLFVVDCSDKRRLDEAKHELEHVLKSEYLEELPVVILANKQDVGGALTATDLTERFNLRKMCSDRNWFVQPCSAVTGVGLEDGFRRMVHLVKITDDANIKDTVKYLQSKSMKSAKDMLSGELEVLNDPLGVNWCPVHVVSFLPIHNCGTSDERAKLLCPEWVGTRGDPGQQRVLECVLDTELLELGCRLRYLGKTIHIKTLHNNATSGNQLFSTNPADFLRGAPYRSPELTDTACNPDLIL
ncbi:hypothetical protein NFI96_001629 [Prochilodus magdalenae]|nr:hypothetical protein NFI96_001629 [Prochilodus magdalenae]